MEDEDPPTLTIGADQERTAVEGHTLGPGADVGGYLVEHKIGSGGMGVVYAATHPLIGKRAAIKVLRPELSKDPAAVERFLTEARSVNQIGHPNIVDIFAFGTLSDGRHYYVMDLLEGESLRTRLRRTGAVHISEAASIIDEIASALLAAHAKGIIHRDLKPDNVFMMVAPGRWPEVKLLDWGLAKLEVSTNKFRTLTGSVLGTPVYMSPEQARAADSVDARTDIYALGVMSYELLSGDVPFRRQSSLDTMVAHQEDRVPPLGERVPGLPEELVQLIEAMLAKSADERPTLAAVRAVLKRLKGTKIPTMTAAGLSMTLPRGMVPTPDVDSDENAITVDHRPSAEMTAPHVGGLESIEVRTNPPRVGPPELGSPTTPLPAVPRTMTGPLAPIRASLASSGPLPPQHSALPLPPPPTHEDLPQIAIARASSADGIPRYVTPPPGSMFATPRPGSLSSPPSGYPQGSIPPQSAASSFLAPPTPPPHVGSRRLVVILVVAIVLTSVGIALALIV